MKLRNGNDTHKFKVICDERSQHNPSSSLLKLPLEIKTLIYGYVCGDETVHIWPDLKQYFIGAKNGQPNRYNSIKLTHCPCSAKKSKSPVPILIGSSEYPHRSCVGSRVRVLDPYSKHPQKLDLSFLRVCRQIYNEGRLVPYETLTFYFNLDGIFKIFLENMPHLNAIRRLHLDIDILLELGRGLMGRDERRPTQWPTVLFSAAEKMPNLQNLHLNIHHEFNECYHYPRKVGVSREDVITDRLLALAKLPLKIVTITVGGSSYGFESDKDDHLKWTVAERQAWAKMVRNRLLDRGHQHQGVEEESEIGTNG